METPISLRREVHLPPIAEAPEAHNPIICRSEIVKPCLACSVLKIFEKILNDSTNK